MFCFKTVETTPFIGDTALPTLGSIATPLPNIPSENTPSFTLSRDIAFPSIGENTIKLPIDFSSILFSTTGSSCISTIPPLAIKSSKFDFITVTRGPYIT